MSEAGIPRETVYKGLFYLLYPPAVFKHVHMQGFFVVAHLIVNSRGYSKHSCKGLFYLLYPPAVFKHVCPVYIYIYMTWGSFVVANGILIQIKLQNLYKSLTKSDHVKYFLCRKQGSPEKQWTKVFSIYCILLLFQSCPYAVAHLIVNSRGCGKTLLQGTFLSIVSLCCFQSCWSGLCDLRFLYCCKLHSHSDQ